MSARFLDTTATRKIMAGGVVACTDGADEHFDLTAIGKLGAQSTHRRVPSANPGMNYTM